MHVNVLLIYMYRYHVRAWCPWKTTVVTEVAGQHMGAESLTCFLFKVKECPCFLTNSPAPPKSNFQQHWVLVFFTSSQIHLWRTMGFQNSWITQKGQNHWSVSAVRISLSSPCQISSKPADNKQHQILGDGKAREVSQQLEHLLLLLKTQAQVSSPTWWLTTTCNSSPSESMALFSPPWAQDIHIINAGKHTHKINLLQQKTNKKSTKV